MHRRYHCLAPLAALVASVLIAGCGNVAPSADGGDARVDGSPMDGRGETGADVSVSCRTNAECDNGVFCDGEERCLGGECAAGPVACDDRHSCTQDSCDEAMRACTNAPDNSMCGDMRACNGIELCAPDAPGANDATGCTPVRPDNVVDCDDANNCTLDTCDDAAGCIHAPRDLDGDGHVDRACTVDGTPGGPAGDDCNDGDERVYPGAVELCEDNRDNNCNGAIDYAEVTCNPSNDTCASATVLPGPGTYWGATRGLRDDYALSCNPGSDADAVFEFTTTAVQDVTVATSSSDGQGAVAVVDGCSPLAEVRCGRGGFSSNPTVRLRSLPAGTHRIVVETGSGGDAFRLILRFDPPTVAPIEDACPVTGSMPAVELNDGMPHVARVSVLEDDYALSCNSFGDSSRDAVFRLTLAAPSDVSISATPPSSGFSNTFVSFRNSPCAASASERRCAERFGPTGVNFTQRALPAGTYWLVVENSDNEDVTITARVTTPPGTTAVEDRCPATGSNPAIELNDGMPHTAVLSALEDDYMLSCNTFASDGNDAVFRLTLAAPADVRITATPSTSGFGGTSMSIRNSPCAMDSSERRCVNTFGSGAATSLQRSMPAGTYWVIVENGDLANMTVQASITTPPTATVTYDATTPTGVTFFDACAAPGATTVLVGVDDATADVPASAVPFPVRFYGIAAPPPFVVSSNGNIALSASGSATTSGMVPDPSDPNFLVAAYWRDLITRSGGVCYASTGTAPNRRFVVEWNDAFHYGGGGGERLTFEIAINEAAPGVNNTIDLIYQTMTGADATAGAGVENEDGTVGTTVRGPFTAPRVVRLAPR